MKKFCLISSFFVLDNFCFFATCHKRRYKLLIEQIREDNRILREDMNKRFEQIDKRFEQVDKRIETLREDMNFRFQILSWVIGGLFLLNCSLLGFLWREQIRIDRKRYDIKHFAYELYRAEPQLKAEIYFQLHQEAKKQKKKQLLNFVSFLKKHEILRKYIFFYFFNMKRVESKVDNFY